MLSKERKAKKATALAAAADQEESDKVTSTFKWAEEWEEEERAALANGDAAMEDAQTYKGATSGSMAHGAGTEATDRPIASTDVTEINGGADVEMEDARDIMAG